MSNHFGRTGILFVVSAVFMWRRDAEEDDDEKQHVERPAERRGARVGGLSDEREHGKLLEKRPALVAPEGGSGKDGW